MTTLLKCALLGVALMVAALAMPEPERAVEATQVQAAQTSTLAKCDDVYELRQQLAAVKGELETLKAKVASFKSCTCDADDVAKSDGPLNKPAEPAVKRVIVSQPTYRTYSSGSCQGGTCSPTSQPRRLFRRWR